MESKLALRTEISTSLSLTLDSADCLRRSEWMSIALSCPLCSLKGTCLFTSGVDYTQLKRIRMIFSHLSLLSWTQDSESSIKGCAIDDRRSNSVELNWPSLQLVRPCPRVFHKSSNDAWSLKIVQEPLPLHGCEGKADRFVRLAMFILGFAQRPVEREGQA